jgi:hypothetical protein
MIIPNIEFNPSLVENFDIFWILIYNNNDIVGTIILFIS